MSLILFHRFLITSAIVFCGGFAVWEFLAFRREGRLSMILLSLAFALAAVGLAIYLRLLRRFLKLPEASTGGRPRSR
ncbi:MAG TPA: hypothetical protein VF188_07225 [Longimicrobiales bacterium]